LLAVVKGKLAAMILPAAIKECTMRTIQCTSIIRGMEEKAHLFATYCAHLGVIHYDE
jgi:hypothetical protein